MAEATDKQPVKKMKEAAEQAVESQAAPRSERECRTFLIEITLVIAVLAFAGLTFLVETTPSFPIDLRITRTLQAMDSPVFAMVMRLISWIGIPPQSFILSALIILLIYILGLQWEAIMTIVAALSSSLVNLLVKQLVARPRPTIDLVDVFEILESYSFPSGHVMYYVGFFGFLWFLVYILFERSIWRTLLLILLGSLVALVGVSRIYLGQHWASDVLGAYLLSAVMLVGLIFFYQWGKNRFFVHQPVAQPDPTEVKREMNQK